MHLRAQYGPNMTHYRTCLRFSFNECPSQVWIESKKNCSLYRVYNSDALNCIKQIVYGQLQDQNWVNMVD